MNGIASSPGSTPSGRGAFGFAQEARASDGLDRRDHPADDEPVAFAYNCLRNSIMAVLTSGARSCWVQCPQPGKMIVRRS